MAARTYDSRGIYFSVDGLGDFGAANGQVRIPGITSLGGPSASASEHDVTDLQSEAMERRPGLPDYGEVSLTAFDNPESIWQRVLANMLDEQEVRQFQVDVTQRTLQAAATTASIRGITIAAASGATPARVTFSGTGFGASLDIRNVARLSEGSVLVSSGTAYVLGQHIDSTRANITRLDGTTVAAVTTAAPYSIVRARELSTFDGYVSSLSPSKEVNARRTIEIGIMVTGKVTRTSSAS